MNDLWKVAISLTGISGIGAFVFLSIYKEWIRSPILAGLTREQKFRLLRIFIVLTFGFGICAFALSAYQSHLKSSQLLISKTEAENILLIHYEYGSSRLGELIDGDKVPKEDIDSLKKLRAKYMSDMMVAKRALKDGQLVVWHEKINDINSLLRSDIAKKYIPEVEIKSMAIDSEIEESGKSEIEKMLDLEVKRKTA